jgi:hypothetical protein
VAQPRVQEKTADAYRLLPGETVPDALRRVARGRIDHALRLLGDGDDRDRVVHEARKDMKKLRAVVRLARSELGRTVARRENARFQAAAGGLSGVRDAKAMVEALDALAENGLHRATAGRVRRALELHRASLSLDEDAVRGAATELEEARAAVGEWRLEGDRWGAIEPGLRRMYRRGRRRMHAAEADPTTESLHDWRKRVKDLWYHLSLLSGTWPAVLEREADQAHELSRLLGNDRDLALLWDFAVAHGVASDRLETAIKARRGELQRDAFALGKRLYAERPRRFSERLGSYWEAWRGDPVRA